MGIGKGKIGIDHMMTEIRKMGTNQRLLNVRHIEKSQLSDYVLREKEILIILHP